VPADKRVEWAPLAEHDLFKMKVAARLSEQYSIWRRRDEIAPGLHSVRVAPHVIFYRTKNGVVEIARVLHERRDLSGLFPQKQD
jgi:plasmid stabilization system protein ParE